MLYVITLGMCVVYVALPYFAAPLIGRKLPRGFKLEAESIVIIAAISFAAYVISYHVSDPELSNRFLHALGGGAVAMIAVALSLHDAKLPLTRYQFLVISILVVTFLGVCNEYAEFFLQTHTPYIYSANPLDTWRDLTSNLIGMLVVGIPISRYTFPVDAPKRKAGERGFTPAWVSFFVVAVVALVSVAIGYDIARTAPPFTPPTVPGATTTAAVIQEQATQLPALLAQGNASLPSTLSAQGSASTSTASAQTWNGLRVYSQSDLRAMAGQDFASGEVPLGDDKYTTSAAKKGYVYLCHVPPRGQGAQQDGPWVHASTNSWNFLAKEHVSGAVSWPQAVFSDIVSGITRVLKGNDLPISHTTGSFPISLSDDVSHYDGNPNAIAAQTLSVSLPASPSYSNTPYCMPTGEVGTMLSGVRLFDGFDAELRDAPAHEAQDSCDGHPQESGEYHYHSLSSCLKGATVDHVIGYADDGFPITGPVVEGGKYLTSADLDECHGLVSVVTDDKGDTYATYHYVMTYDFPYSVSCFRGKPAVTSPPTGGSGGKGGGQNNSASPPAGGGGPPQAAIDACSGKTSGASCSMQTPNGTLSGTCRTPPNQSQLACIPQ